MVEGPRHLPLTAAQLGHWLEHELVDDKSLHTIGEFLTIRGALDVGIFGEALQRLVDRTEALRIHVTWRDGVPTQEVRPGVPSGLAVHDMRGPDDAHEDARRWMGADIRRPFVPSSGPLFRFTLLHVGDDEWIWYYAYHHVIMDGAGMALLAERMADAYTALLRGVEPESPTTLTLEEMVHSDLAYRDSVERAQARVYWLSHLGSLSPPRWVSPASGPREPSAAELSTAPISAQCLARLERIALDLGSKHRCRPSHVLFALTHLYLARLTHGEDVAIGVPRANRAAGPARATPGMFSNVMVPRVQASPSMSLRDLILEVTRVLREGARHQRFPLHELVRDLGILGTGSTSPFTAMFNYMPFSYPVTFGAARADLETLSLGPCWDLHFSFRGTSAAGDGRLDLFYPGSLYSPDQIALHRDRFLHLLEMAHEHLGTPLIELPLLTDRERRQVLSQWNDTVHPVPEGACLHTLVERQAALTPDAVAIVFREQEVTYRELDGRANQLAHYLRKLGVGHEDLVGLCLRRSPELVVAILGILKAGGAYVPLDTRYPRGRMESILTEARVHLVVTEAALAETIPDEQRRLVCLDSLSAELRDSPGEAPPALAKPTSLAYVMFTSGSTGRPKGVAVEHRSIVNLLTGIQTWLEVGADETHLGVASPAFDISLSEYFLPLSVGATAALVSDEVTRDASLLLRELDRIRPRLIQATPATWQVLLDAGWRGGPDLVLVSTGERLPPPLAAALRQQCGRLWNLYGPTEATIWATGLMVEANAVEDSIGRPLPNCQAFVLDERLEPSPIGIPGELYLGGSGLAREYLGRPDLTAERFVPHPFVPGARLYKTGDRARWRTCGSVTYMGRLDHQVKLRGYRLELGEVEATLCAMDAVSLAAVTLHEDPRRGKRLVAYWTAHDGAEATVGELRAHLAERLPEYMVPATFVQLPALPLSPSGKVDRKALPVPDDTRPDLGATYVAPRNDTEQRLSSLWAELLGVERVGIHDNFFDLGGDSLLAIRLCCQVPERLGVPLQIASLLRNPTIAQVAERLGRERRTRGGDFVTLCRGGNGRPLFFLPGVTRTSGTFTPLCQALDCGRPLYGLSLPVAIGSKEPLTTLQAMGTHCVREILATQPAGPYLLAGFSFGGLVAYETATQLIARGESVARLFLFDTGLVDRVEPDLSDLRALVRRVGQSARYRARRLVDRALRRVRGLPAKAVPVAGVINEEGWLPEALRVALRRKYRPVPLNTYVVLFHLPGNNDPKWRSLALGGLETHEVRANKHTDVFDERFLGRLASVVSAHVVESAAATEASTSNSAGSDG